MQRSEGHGEQRLCLRTDEPNNFDYSPPSVDGIRWDKINMQNIDTAPVLMFASSCH